MIVKGFDCNGEPFSIKAPFVAVKPGDRVVVDSWYHEVVVIDLDGVVHVGRAFQ